LEEWGNGAETEARDGGGAGARPHLESAEDLDRRGGLVAESEDEDAGLDFLGREQIEASGLPPQLDLCCGPGGERDIGQSVAKRGVACLVEGGEPAVEEVAGGSVGNEAHLVAEAGQVNEDGGVNGADVVSRAGGHRSVGWITENDGVDLRRIVFLVGGRGGSGCGAGGTGSAGAAGGEMCRSGVTQAKEDRGQRADSGHCSKQDGSGVQRLAAGDIEARSCESGDSGREGLPHGWVVLGRSGGGRIGAGPARLAATDIVNGPPKSGVS